MSFINGLSPIHYGHCGICGIYLLRNTLRNGICPICIEKKKRKELAMKHTDYVPLHWDE